MEYNRIGINRFRNYCRYRRYFCRTQPPPLQRSTPNMQHEVYTATVLACYPNRCSTPRRQQSFVAVSVSDDGNFRSTQRYHRIGCFISVLAAVSSSVVGGPERSENFALDGREGTRFPELMIRHDIPHQLRTHGHRGSATAAVFGDRDTPS